MTTYQDLSEDGRHEIIVRVRDCSRARVEKRAFELSVEDTTGTRFQFIVWEKSEAGRNYDWQEGCWYRLKGVTANKWPSGVVLHGASALRVERLGSEVEDEQEDVLYFTDSHLGKNTHSYGGEPWSVSPENGFHAAIDRAIDENVAAVVHGGDLFHNPGSGIKENEIAVCRDGLGRLAENGIPFYFIYGNHERQAGRRVLERFADDGLAKHLGPRYEAVGDVLALYGIDHRSEWDDLVLDLEQPPAEMATMLCIHQSTAPFTKSNKPDCSLTGISNSSNIELDLIVTGHTHSRSLCSLNKSQGLAGGATARVGETSDDLLPSIELISTEKGQVTSQQQYL